MARVVHFEITADDPDRAAEFYRKVFGWEVTGWGATPKYLLATTGPADQAGINGAITERQPHRQAVINTVDVDDWDRAAQAVRAAGGEVLMEKSAIPGVGYFAYCLDSERNVFGILQSDSGARVAEAPVAAGETAR